MRPLTPIERMVDAACRFVEFEGPPEPPEDGVLLVCASCGKKQWDERIPDYFDFETVMSTCPSCA